MGGRFSYLPLLRRIPIVDVPAHLILGKAIALLDLAFQLLAAAVDCVQVVAGELAPLFLDLALDLLPICFGANASAKRLRCSSVTSKPAVMRASPSSSTQPAEQPMQRTAKRCTVSLPGRLAMQNAAVF
jgi:hypothetical protein